MENVGFIENFTDILAVKEFWKSVKIWLGYCDRSWIILLNMV